MAPQDVPNLGGKIRVKFPPPFANYRVYAKEIPDELKKHPKYDDYEWVGSFGIKDDKGNNVPGKVSMAYEVQVEKISGKNTLFYWNGSEILKLNKGQRDFKDGSRSYRGAQLDLGDPPVGWA